MEDQARRIGERESAPHAYAAATSPELWPTTQSG